MRKKTEINHRNRGLLHHFTNSKFATLITINAMKSVEKAILFLLLFVVAFIYIMVKLPQLDFNSAYDETVL